MEELIPLCSHFKDVQYITWCHKSNLMCFDLQSVNFRISIHDMYMYMYQSFTCGVHNMYIYVAYVCMCIHVHVHVHIHVHIHFIHIHVQRLI